MLTIAQVRSFTPEALDYTAKDLQEALANVRAFDDAHMPYDTRRASEYHDELALVAQVRYERKAKPVCPCCGKVL